MTLTNLVCWSHFFLFCSWTSQCLESRNVTTATICHAECEWSAAADITKSLCCLTVVRLTLVWWKLWKKMDKFVVKLEMISSLDETDQGDRNDGSFIEHFGMCFSTTIKATTINNWKLQRFSEFLGIHMSNNTCNFVGCSLRRNDRKLCS